MVLTAPATAGVTAGFWMFCLSWNSCNGWACYLGGLGHGSGHELVLLWFSVAWAWADGSWLLLLLVFVFGRSLFLFHSGVGDRLLFCYMFWDSPGMHGGWYGSVLGLGRLLL